MLLFPPFTVFSFFTMRRFFTPEEGNSKWVLWTPAERRPLRRREYGNSRQNSFKLKVIYRGRKQQQIQILYCIRKGKRRWTVYCPTAERRKDMSKRTHVQQDSFCKPDHLSLITAVWSETKIWIKSESSFSPGTLQYFDSLTAEETSNVSLSPGWNTVQSRVCVRVS